VKEEYPAIHRKAINILLQFSSSYMCEQAFSCLSSIKSKGRTFSLQLKMNSICAYLKFSPKLSTCAAKNKQSFYSKEVNFTLYFSLKNNTVLDHMFVHVILIYLMVFSDLTIQHFQ
jgi:hypothetical protein